MLMVVDGFSVVRNFRNNPKITDKEIIDNEQRKGASVHQKATVLAVPSAVVVVSRGLSFLD